MAKPALIAALLLCAAFTPAVAADLRHDASGITVPETIGDMRRGAERDLSDGKALDLMIQYGSDTEPVTLYLYRGAFPNPALWFERTRHAMKLNVGLATNAVAPRAFTLGGAPAPNGLREEAALTGAGPWRSTAVAIAAAGEWMIKSRITSQTLDQAGVSAKMDRLLGAIRFDKAPAGALPLIVPAACDSEGSYSGKATNRDREKRLAAGMISGVVALSMSRGQSGLAADPNGWCRARSGHPAEHLSLYRKRDGETWVALLGDAGRAVIGLPFEEFAGAKGAALLSSNPTSVQIVGLFDGPPPPDTAVLAALPVVAGAQRGLVEIGLGAAEPKR